MYNIYLDEQIIRCDLNLREQLFTAQDFELD